MSISTDHGNNGKSFEDSLLSVVISFYNEADALPELIRRLRDVLDSQCEQRRLGSYELIFVNDDSTDRSEAILREAAKGRDDIRIITMSRNFGVSECVLAGMEYSSGDAVVYMDADLQDPPEVIPELIRSWQDGDDIDVVNTVRDAREGESAVKLLITRIGYKILRSVAEIDLTIESGDFKLLSRRAVDELLRLKERKPFIRGMISWIGFKQACVHYHRQARFSGETKFRIYSRRVIRNFLDSALISFSDIPLKLALVLGGFVAILSFVFLVYVIVQKFVLRYTTPGWSAIMASMLFLGGVQLMTIGVLGLYVGSIFFEVKGRPNYIVESTFGFRSDLEGKTDSALHSGSPPRHSRLDHDRSR